MGYTQTFMLVADCPYCKIHVNFIEIKPGGNDPRSNIPIRFNMQNEKLIAGLLLCPSCKAEVLGFFHHSETKEVNTNRGILEDHIYKIKFTYPFISTKSKPPSIDQKVWDDYSDGVTALSANIPKAAVTMFRRGLQQIMKHLGADKEKTLFKQIKEIKSKGKITDNLYEIATEVRLWGNFGAHPDDDLLQDVTLEEAGEMKEIFYLMLDAIYIQPAKVKELEAKRKSKKTP